MSVNKAIIVGRLGQDPESNAVGDDKTVTRLSVATSESWKDKSGENQERTEWHRVVCWGKLAEVCAKHCGKGMQVYVEGKIQTRSWDDQDGNKKYRTEIVAETMQMGPRPAGTSGEAPNKPDRTESKPQQTEKKDNGDEIKIEDIPF